MSGSSAAAASDRRHPGLNLGHRHGSAHEEAEETIFGFWVFLMSDLVLFGCLFATFGTTLHATAGGPDGRALFDLPTAAYETAALLASSFTFGMASLSMKYRHADPKYRYANAGLLGWLGLTLALGLLFLGLEVKDFLDMCAKGGGPDRSGFTAAVFALVGTHGLHVPAGSCWVAILIVQIMVFGVTDAVKLRLMRLALFWHFLDIVWVGIFSAVYLLGLA